MSRTATIVAVTASLVSATTSIASIGRGYDLSQPAGVDASATLAASSDSATTLGYCPDLSPREVTADVNMNDAVSTDDVFAWLDYYFAGSKLADANRDGFVNADDIFVFLELWTVAFTQGDLSK